MIIFVNLGDQINKGYNEFAFYDMTSNCFHRFDGNIKFFDHDHFNDCFMKDETGMIQDKISALPKWLALIPDDWVDVHVEFEDKPNDPIIEAINNVHRAVDNFKKTCKVINTKLNQKS